VLDPQTRRSLQEISQRSKEGKAQVVVTLNASNGVIQKLKEHCQSGRPLSGLAADVLHEIYHNARALSDPNEAVSDHYFEHRNSLLSRLVDLERDNTDLEKNLSNARVRISALEKTEISMNKDFEQRVCALLLTDLRGSTRMVGFLDRLESARILRDYANEMKQIIEEHGGRVDKFTGDGIFAYFWSPDLNPDRMVNNAKVCAAQINIATSAFFSRSDVKSPLLDQAGIEVIGSRTALHYGAVNYANIAGSPTLVGPNVVTLFRILEQKSLLDRCPVILTGAFVTAAQLGTQVQPLERNYEIDPSLPRQMIYPHPNWAVKSG
jgi:class 3 adenylate cyclase